MAKSVKASEKRVDENPTLNDYIYGFKEDGENVRFKLSDIKVLIETIV